jgi:hypothetical protein
MMECASFYTVVETVTSVKGRDSPLINRFEVSAILHKLFESPLATKLTAKQDFETLKDQICALFFTTSIPRIDVAFF